MNKSVRTSIRLAYGLFRNPLSHSESSLSLFQIYETRRDLLETEPMVRACLHDHSSGSYPAGQSRLGGYHQHLAPSLLIFPLGTEHTELQEDMTQSTFKHDHLISQSSCAELGQLQWPSSALDSKHSSSCTLNIIEVNKTWHDSG